MKTPAVAILWQIYRAQRWGVYLCGVYLLACVIAAQFLPTMLRSAGFDSSVIPNVGWQLATPSILALVYLAAIFSATGSADLQEKGYTSFMLTLPVSSKTLAIWPAIWGMIALSSVWLTIALGILRPTHNTPPLLWPIAALAVLLTLLQAVSWTPMAQNWLRLLVALFVLTAPMIAVAMVHFLEISEAFALCGFAAVLPISVWACFHGIAMARRGDTYDWRFATRIGERISAWRKPVEHPFASAAAAQAWFEFRLYGRMLPFCVLLVSPGFILMWIVIHRDEVERVWHMLAALLLLPTIFALTVGLQIGNITFPFLAIRPISTMQLVASKFRMALVSAILASAIVICLAPLFLLRPAIWDSLSTLVRTVGPIKTTGVIGLAFIAPWLLAWKFLIESFWMTLCGRPWVMNTIVFTAASIMGVSTLFGLWIWTREEYHRLCIEAVPWLAFGLLIAKLAVASRLVWKLQEKEIMSGKAGMMLLFLWLTAVTAVTFLVQSQLRPMQIGPDTLVAAVALAIPFNRIAAAPLMLDWNRHR